MTTIERLKEMIEKEFEIPASELDADAPLTDYGLDSLSLAELMFTVEDRFAVEFPSDQAQAVDTLASLAQLIDSLRLARAA